MVRMVGFAVHGPGRVHVFGNTQFVLGTKPGRVHDVISLPRMGGNK